jgi:hypothetical protein
LFEFLPPSLFLTPAEFIKIVYYSKSKLKSQN